MSELPVFFLPASQEDQQESMYAHIAEQYGRSVPVVGQRIYSITYVHDSEQWTATVGEHLKGIQSKVVRSRGIKTERTIRLHDCAVVVAIFPGHPYIVVTDGCLVSGGLSQWENPFFAGNPISVTYFSR